MKQVFMCLMLVLLTSCGFEIVDTGHRGVEINMGKVVGTSLEEGLYFYNPLTSDIVEMSVQVITYTEQVNCYTKDLQKAEISVSAMIFPQKEAVHLLYRDVGQSWQEKLVSPTLNGAVKTVIGKWDAVDLIGNREKARSEIETQLKDILAKSAVNVSNIEIANIDYADEFEKSVERKVVAIQEAIEAQNKTKQIEEEAKQSIITAEADAKSMKIRSDALSQNKSLVEYEAVQKWDGKLPEFMAGNSTPFINLKMKE